MKARIMKVSRQFLLDALNLPEDTVLLDAKVDIPYDEIDFRIVHDDFEELPEGSNAPVISPWFHTDDKGNTKMTSWDGYPDESD